MFAPPSPMTTRLQRALTGPLFFTTLFVSCFSAKSFAAAPIAFAAALPAASFATPPAAPQQHDAVVAWGGNQNGERSLAPTGNGFAFLASGYSHGVAIRFDGSISAWGLDSSGQVSSAPTVGAFTFAAAGQSHSLALLANGSVESWGDNTHGQVGNTPGGSFVAVAAGHNFSLAQRNNGSFVAWGSDSHGQVSNAPAGTGFLEMDGGQSHGIALAADGSIVSWGDDSFNQISNTPAGTGFQHVSAGGNFSVALHADGSLTSWGENSFGQISSTPGSSGFTKIAAGQDHAFALTPDGTLVGWGRDSWLQVSTAPSATSHTSIACGLMHSFALLAPDDTDGDGLSDDAEAVLNTDPLDQDTDDDGLSDGEENAGVTNPLLLDSDSDGLQDGTESGETAGQDGDPLNGIAGTDPAIFVPDTNPSFNTDPDNPDTDGGGVLDGTEDFNRNGAYDPKSETNALASGDDELAFYVGNLHPGSDLQFEVRQGRAMATFIPAYSLAGPGPTPIAGGLLDINLSTPFQQLNPFGLDLSGNASVIGPHVPGTAPLGVTVWLHGLEIYLPGNPTLRTPNSIELKITAD